MTELSAGIESTWCGHIGQYTTTAHMCMGRGQSETIVRCLTENCEREYLGSQLRSWVAARKAPPDADRCKHEILRADCGECRPRPPRQRRARAASPPGLFAAKFPGRCADCENGRIEPGDMIRRAESNGYLCTSCAAD